MIKLGKDVDMIHMPWGRRWKYLHGVFIDEIYEEEGDPQQFMVCQAGRPTKELGIAYSMAEAKDLAREKGEAC